MAHARAQRVEVAEFLRVLRHVQLDALVDFIRRARGTHDFILGKHPCLRAFGVGLDAFGDGILFSIGNIGIHAHDGVVVVQLAILLVDDVVDGVLQAKASEQKPRATRNADNRHEETALIAEEVARGDLPAERHAAPQRTNAFEQNAFAGLRRARQHKGRRLFAQGGHRGEQRCRNRDAHRKARCQQEQRRVDWRRPARHNINNRVRVHDEPRQELRQQHNAHD